MSNPNDQAESIRNGGKLPIGLFDLPKTLPATLGHLWTTFGKNAASMLLGRTGDIPSEHPLAQGTLAPGSQRELPAEELVCRMEGV